ncbi:MAG: winged helix-turn-helix transcriptional regulator [archaeon]|nr:winged helix-turn-helix transcriptional regulator [archaeon]
MGKKNLKLYDILEFIMYENPATQDEIAEKLGISRRYVTQLLKPLIDEGTVKRSYMVDLKKFKKIKEQYGEPASKEKIGNIFIADLLRNMAKHVMEQLETSFNSLLDNDEQLANTALEMDFITNNMVDNVRTSVETMVSVGYNYQFSKSILYTEVASDLERIGDYCGHIAKFAANEIFEIDEDILANMRNMYKTSQKMIRFSMIAFLENKTDLKEEVMVMEETLHYLQAQSVNSIAAQMAENTFEEKERSNYFMYLFRVIKAFERIGDISTEIVDVAIEFHKNIPRPITPRSFR